MLYKYRWITAVGLVIKSSKHLITTLFSWLSSCFYEPFFAQPCLLLLQRNVGGSNETTNIPNRRCEETVCTSFTAGPDSHVGARLNASLVGRLSSLNDRDSRLLSVCVVSWWLQRGVGGMGSADTSCARSDTRPVCPLAASGNGPQGSLVLDASSRKTWLSNIERWNQQSPARFEGDKSSITTSEQKQPLSSAMHSLIILDDYFI